AQAKASKAARHNGRTESGSNRMDEPRKEGTNPNDNTTRRGDAASPWATRNTPAAKTASAWAGSPPGMRDDRAAIQQRVDLGHVVFRFLRRRRAHLALVGKQADARQQAVPRHDRVAAAEGVLRDARADRAAGQPRAQQLLQRFGKVRVGGVGAPVVGVAARV